MRTILFLGAAAAAAFATAAQAQDMSADPAPFSGIYVGASGGYDVQPNDVGSSILFDRGSNGSFGDTVSTAAGANAFAPGFCNGRAVGATPLPGSCRNDKDGWSYYGRIGMDAQRGNIVVGALGEFGKTEINDSVSGFSTTPANYVMTRDVKWEASSRVCVACGFGAAARSASALARMRARGLLSARSSSAEPNTWASLTCRCVGRRMRTPRS